ncbi:unnamed protein product [Larinioides sclopetarius]|uniref:Uncharacterized protein n=1 Tax=Larinioides sclopetarius TaxID=280406 RepID=A0AAV2AY08_9ARAC
MNIPGNKFLIRRNNVELTTRMPQGFCTGLAFWNLLTVEELQQDCPSNKKTPRFVLCPPN